jgi:hypothetical protein
LVTALSPKNVAFAAAVSGMSVAVHLMPGISYLQLVGGFAVVGSLAAELLPKLIEAHREEVALRRNALFFVINIH